jgi:2-iminobutanoate/2-iminopropanoate deaminase
VSEGPAEPASGGLRRIRLPDVLPEPMSHYCDAVAADGWLYVSGLLSLTRDGELVGAGDARAQARAILTTLKEVLGHVGAGMADVVKVTVYLVDMDERAQVNVEREAAFGPSRPASTLVEVSRLAHPDALVEIECVARISRSP